MAEPRLCTPFPVRTGHRLKQVAVQAVVAAMMSNIILDRLLGEFHQAANFKFDPCRRSEIRQRLRLAGARLQIFDGPGLAEPPAEALNITGELGVATRLGIRHQFGERAPNQLLLRPPLDWLETRSDSGLRREGREERLGKGMDRLDLQPAGTIQDSSEQLAGSLPGSRVVWFSKSEQVFSKQLVGKSHPCREPSADPVRHLGRGRFRECQTKYGFG